VQHLLLVALVALSGAALSQGPPGYYGGVDTSTPATLRASLHGVIDDHVRQDRGHSDAEERGPDRAVLRPEWRDRRARTGDPALCGGATEGHSALERGHVAAGIQLELDEGHHHPYLGARQGPGKTESQRLWGWPGPQHRRFGGRALLANVSETELRFSPDTRIR